MSKRIRKLYQLPPWQEYAHCQNSKYNPRNPLNVLMMYHLQLAQKTIQIQLSEVKRRQKVQKIFTTTCTQRQLFATIQPIINQAKDGYNVTIFTYGQTGSGKTYTMFGSDWLNIIKSQKDKMRQATFLRSIQQDQNHAGVIPRVIQHVFTNLIIHRPKHIKVFCSFLQIYNEQMIDLFEDDKNIKKNMQIHENKTDGIYVEGLNEVQVCDVDECIGWMQKGQRNRTVRQTHMNIKSSRSHTIFQILLEQVFPNKKSFRRMKINLCDLAGSEKINKNERMEVQHFQQLRNINLSLTSLGKVISALSTSSKPAYRDSKLTRILQDSVGGNAQTAIIATITTKFANVEQSLNTLKFLERAKQIKTQIVNRVFNENAEMRELQKQIAYLKDLLKMKRNGVGYDLDTTQVVHKLKAQNDKLRQLVDKQLVDKLIKENNHLKRQLQKKNNDDLSDSYLRHKTIQKNNEYISEKVVHYRQQSQSQIEKIKTSLQLQSLNSQKSKKNAFNKSYTNKQQTTTLTNKQAKTTIFPILKGSTKPSPVSRILDRIQQIENMKKLNRAKLQRELISIQQRQSLDERKTFKNSSKYSKLS